MLQIDSLTKKYNQFTALEQVSLTVSKGSIHGLVGKNGAGKTTLLKTVMGIYQADKGQITWNANTIYEQNDTKSLIYLIPDFLQFSIFDTLKDLANQHRSLYPQWSEERYQKLVKGLNLNDKKALVRFSKGEQRQMIFCLALSTMPELLILDEPFDGLDPVIRHQIKNLLIQDVAERELCVFVSSHNLRELDDLCDTITIIHDGKIQISNDLDSMKTKIHKIQIAFKEEPIGFEKELNLLYVEKRGSLHLLVVRGDSDPIMAYLNTLNPSLLEVLPLNLEELFIYEMEGLHYERKNITL